MSEQLSELWECVDPLTMMLRTRDGTAIPIEAVNSVTCFADLLSLANMRAKQRAEMAEKRNEEVKDKK